LDLYTIREHRHTLNGVKVAILGDLLNGRTIHSLLRLISLYDNVEVYGLSKECFALPQKYIDLLQSRGIEYKKCNSFDDIPKDVDVLYHTRIQSERFEGDFGKEEFIINKEVLDKFSENTIVLHPLPRVDEISTDIDDDPRAMYFKQAHNGLYVRMALFVQAFEK
jgi:aspartate carbamoyltransferase catalytic subunit